MKHEKSCGAVVYRIIDNNIEFLIIESVNGHFSFPKGHREKDETEIVTAIREIKEETNLEVELDDNFRECISYMLNEQTVKNVVFFLAKFKNGELRNQPTEIKSVKWMNYEEALKILSFTNDRGILSNAKHYIQIKENLLIAN